MRQSQRCSQCTQCTQFRLNLRQLRQDILIPSICWNCLPNGIAPRSPFGTTSLASKAGPVLLESCRIRIDTTHHLHARPKGGRTVTCAQAFQHTERARIPHATGFTGSIKNGRNRIIIKTLQTLNQASYHLAVACDDPALLAKSHPHPARAANRTFVGHA